MAVGIFRVEAYGASASASDNVSAIQAAIDAAEAYVTTHDKPAVVLFEDIYPLVSTTTSSSLNWHLTLNSSKIKLMGFGKESGLSSAQNAAFIYFNQQNQQDHGHLLLPSLTTYGISAASRGAMSVTLTSPSDADNFSVGDYVYIRTGQTISVGVNQPDAELNKITGISNGILTLQTPLCKPYAQEYFISGTSGATSTTETANAAIFGIANAQGLLLEDIELNRLGFYGTGTSASFIGGGLISPRILHCYFEVAGNLFSIGGHKGARYEDNEVYISGPGIWKWAFPADTACSDFWMVRNFIYGDRVVFLHIHEGSSRGVVRDNIILSTPSNSNEDVISIRGRAYGHIISDNILVNSGTGPVIFVDAACDGGGIIGPNSIQGTNFTSAVAVAAPNWVVLPQDLRSGIVSVFDDQINAAPVFFSGWAADDARNPTLGTLPARTIPTRVLIDVQEAFNSDGADTLTVGWDADTDALVTRVDVSSTGLIEVTLSSNNGVSLGRFNGTTRTVEAYYANDGTEPTTGKVLITVEYVPVQNTVS